jgi:acyl-CoA oxidase
MPLPGIEVGDLGTKVGDNFVDIGYLRMRQVRIPRRHLMEKRHYVEADGTFVKVQRGRLYAINLYNSHHI